MFKVLILVCASSVSPSDCQLETALDVIHGPQVASVFECGMASQATAARSTILRNAPVEYMKVKCGPSGPAGVAKFSHAKAALEH